MIAYTTRPISGWAGEETRGRKRPPFGSTWSATESLLEHELRQLHATGIVLQLDVREQDLRVNGTLRANARTASPRVRLLFDTPDAGTLAFQCDRFTDWQSNARAIALGLEALRKVDRYGISSGGEQYKGYLAIEGAPATATTSADDARAVLARWSRRRISPDSTRDWLRICWREARAFAHPDRNNGDRAGWDAVEEAATVLGVTR